MTNITFTIPSVLNRGGGEKKVEISAATLTEAFTKISENMGDEFKRRVLNDDGTPRSLINIYINGKNAKFSSGMEMLIRDRGVPSSFNTLLLNSSPMFSEIFVNASVSVVAEISTFFSPPP